MTRRQRFRKYRKALGLTQPEVCVALGYNVSEPYRSAFISNKECGQKAVTNDDLWRLEELMIDAGLRV